MRSRNEEGAAADFGAAGNFGVGGARPIAEIDCFGRSGGGCGGCIEGRRDMLLMFEARRLRVLDGGGGELPCLADEDAVCATRCAGSLTGRVGERGLGLMKPPVVTVPEDSLDLALTVRSDPALVGVSLITADCGCSAASASTATSCGIDWAGSFLDSVGFGAGVGVGGSLALSLV
jgi:hypothetical protein